MFRLALEKEPFVFTDSAIMDRPTLARLFCINPNRSARLSRALPVMLEEAVCSIAS